MTNKFLLSLSILGATSVFAADQTVVGAGNARAQQIAAKSQLVQTAKQTLIQNAGNLQDSFLRKATLDAIGNPSTCIQHRIGVGDAKKTTILASLLSAGLYNPADAAGITGGVKAGVFPPVLDEGTSCPHLPLAFDAAPGSAFGGHHSYPGGLPIHEANNDESFINFADLYRGSYGDTGKGLPSFNVIDNRGQSKKAEDTLLSQDLVLGAPLSRNDCLTYADFIQTGTTADGQAIGHGCVYPASVKTIANQLTAAHRTWRAYMEDMGNDPSRETSTCGHPALNTIDHTQSAQAPSTTVPLGDAYAARHNPFVYFHAIIDSPDCFTNVVNLNQMVADLKSTSTTPNVSFITPNLCHDGHDAPCVNGEPGGLVSADAFLQKWVPLITSAPAFKNGLLVINFDEGGFSVSVNSAGGVVISAEGETCCSERKGPNLGTFPQSSMIGTFTLSFGSYGGDRTGAVLLSPFVRAGKVSNAGFNHYSLLKTIEDIFDLDYLGYAGAPGLVPFFGCGASDVDSHGNRCGN